LAALCQSEPGLAVAGSYATAEEALMDLPVADPWLALVDLQLPGLSGLDYITRARARLPELKILVVTAAEEPTAFRRAIQLGADGFLVKTCAAMELLPAIRRLREGGVLAVSQKILSCLSLRPVGLACTGACRPRLSQREQEVLALAAEDLRNKEIAQRLRLALATVSGYWKTILFKLHVHSCGAAIALWASSRKHRL
jgi:DNA-binding NarL/FixJ family response regulator